MFRVLQAVPRGAAPGPRPALPRDPGQRLPWPPPASFPYLRRLQARALRPPQPLWLPAPGASCQQRSQGDTRSGWGGAPALEDRMSRDELLLASQLRWAARRTASPSSLSAPALGVPTGIRRFLQLRAAPHPGPQSSSPWFGPVCDHQQTQGSGWWLLLYKWPRDGGS